MNKKDLIEKISETVDTTKADAERFIDAFVDNVTNSLKKGDAVALTGFGTFSVTRRKARTARNPRTGETVQVAAKNAPKFKPGKGLKDAVNA